MNDHFSAHPSTARTIEDSIRFSAVEKCREIVSSLDIQSGPQELLTP
jgi:hypothetical protein